jgi:hypothetical protein
MPNRQAGNASVLGERTNLAAEVAAGISHRNSSTVPRNHTARSNEPFALETLSQVRQGDIEAWSFAELDAFVDQGVHHIALNMGHIIAVRRKMRPAIQRIHALLSSQGKRTDLHIPDSLTFDRWIKSKENLGSRATIYRLLALAGLPQKQLPEGTRVVELGSREVGVVTHTEVIDTFENENKETLSVSKLRKLPVRKIIVGDLFTFEDKDAEYRYAGDCKFVRTGSSVAHKKPREIRKKALKEKKRAQPARHKRRVA